MPTYTIEREQIKTFELSETIASVVEVLEHYHADDFHFNVIEASTTPNGTPSMKVRYKHPVIGFITGHLLPQSRLTPTMTCNELMQELSYAQWKPSLTAYYLFKGTINLDLNETYSEFIINKESK